MIEFSIKNLNQEELKIVNKWPEVYLYPSPFVQSYIDSNYVSKEDACNLRYSFEFGKGWLKLADELGEKATALVKLLKDSGIQKDAYIKSCVFKQKFGILTFQGDDNLNGIYSSIWRDIVSCIEERSGRVCENTGKDGTLCVRGGYFQTLCKEEAQKLGFYPQSKYYQNLWKLYPPVKKSE